MEMIRRETRRRTRGRRRADGEGKKLTKGVGHDFIMDFRRIWSNESFDDDFKTRIERRFWRLEGF